MPDPLTCLRELRRVVKDDGIIALLCEPVGYYQAETLSSVFRNELERGINEQIFSAEEYQHLFMQAGLFATRVIVDRGSIKAILRPQIITNAVVQENPLPEPTWKERWMRRLSRSAMAKRIMF